MVHINNLNCKSGFCLPDLMCKFTPWWGEKRAFKDYVKWHYSSRLNWPVLLIQIYRCTDLLLHLYSLPKSIPEARPKKYTSVSGEGGQGSPKGNQPEGKEAFGLPCSSMEITFSVCHWVSEWENELTGAGTIEETERLSHWMWEHRSSFILYWGRSGWVLLSVLSVEVCLRP